MIQRLRTQMLKNPNHELWNKDLNKWDSNDKKEFEAMEAGKIIQRKQNKFATNSQRVLRISDGKEYRCILDCRNDNNLSNHNMYLMLDEQLKFKRI